MQNPVLTITTISGDKVSAPLVKWVQGLILRLPPEELIKLMCMVEDSQNPVLTISRDTIPADPEEWLRGVARRT